ncbi:MAG: hypothetical protein FWD71_08495 [Oscillospiraceae bacterium]|nr:hypothetical protein [Oscillospiraceae bacterium]
MCHENTDLSLSLARLQTERTQYGLKCILPEPQFGYEIHWKYAVKKKAQEMGWRYMCEQIKIILLKMQR